ncbi:MAG TPA: hypothetical protein PKE55_00985 [Kiritimatiellia bacterium]|nr:hypothetical protein [Kiritimatiellia bacterium]
MPVLRNRGAVLALLILVIGYATLVGYDWYARFARYRFEMQLFHLPERAMSGIVRAAGVYQTNQMAIRRGGDLSSLIGIAKAAEPYVELRSAGVRIRDPWGYFNPEPVGGEGSPCVVVAGDSFMAVGTHADMLSTVLQERIQGHVYNHALIGHGPFLSVERFLRDERWLETPPRYLIWGFVEREISGSFFERFRHSIRTIQEKTSRESSSEGDPSAPMMVESKALIVHWPNFRPERLSDSLPASSYLAQSSQWAWNRLRYLAFGRIHPDLVPVHIDELGKDLLFYRYHIENLQLDADARQLPLVVEAILSLDDLCRSRGMTLLVLLVPEKEQVYRDWLSSVLGRDPNSFPPSSLNVLTTELTRQGMGERVINLLPDFRAAALEDGLLYWRDDTHWNPQGMALAADRLALLIQDCD